MRYESIEDLPTVWRVNLPETAQHVYKDAFNRAWAERRDERAARTHAWNAVRRNFRRDATGTGYLAGSIDERAKLLRIERAVGAHAAADVEGERLHGGDGIAHVRRFQASGEKQRNIDAGADLRAEGPVVHAPGAAELLDGGRLIAGVEQQRVDVRRNGARFVDGARGRSEERRG